MKDSKLAKVVRENPISVTTFRRPEGVILTDRNAMFYVRDISLIPKTIGELVAANLWPEVPGEQRGVWNTQEASALNLEMAFIEQQSMELDSEAEPALVAMMQEGKAYAQMFESEKNNTWPLYQTLYIECIPTDVALRYEFRHGKTKAPILFVFDKSYEYKFPDEPKEPIAIVMPIDGHFKKKPEMTQEW